MQNTKRSLLFSMLMLMTGGSLLAQTVENANVALGNLTENFYFDSYDDNTKTIKKLNFLALADGNNSAKVTPAFTIKVYIWDGSTPHFVKTFNDQGLYHFGSREYVDQDIDLSELELPAGTYRVGVFIDADNAIPDPPDDPSDNAYLAQGNINFTPGGGSTGTAPKPEFLPSFSCYPNPASDVLNINWNSGDNKARTIEIKDISGRAIKQFNVADGIKNMAMPVGDLVAGMYLVSVISNDGVSVRRFVKQ